MGTSVKRSLFQSFLNTGTVGTPVWSLIGDGISSAKINYSPQVLTETYIHQDSANTEVESYQPTMPVKMVAKAGDTVFDFVDAMRQARAVMADAHAEIVNVWLYETPSLGEYPAERQAVSIQFDDFGGDGGKSTELNYTINFVGDPELGTYNPTSGDFTPNPNLAGLSALTIGSLVFTPAFAEKKLFYTVTTATTPQTVTATSVDPAASVDIKNGVTEIDTDTGGATGSATLALGVNHITAEVTVGTEVVTYHVDVTKTA